MCAQDISVPTPTFIIFIIKSIKPLGNLKDASYVCK